MRNHTAEEIAILEKAKSFKIVDQAACDQANAYNELVIKAATIDNYGAMEVNAKLRDDLLVKAYGFSSINDLKEMRRVQSLAYRIAFGDGLVAPAKPKFRRFRRYR